MFLYDKVDGKALDMQDDIDGNIGDTPFLDHTKTNDRDLGTSQGLYWSGLMRMFTFLESKLVL